MWAKAEGVIYDKVIPKLNGVDRDDPEIGDLTAMELADYFYSEYKNYVHDHPEEKGRVDDYADYVLQNASKVDKNFTPKESETKSSPLNDFREADVLTELNYRQSPEQKKRMKDAADLGLKALADMGRDSYDKSVGITNDDRYWFVWEDQTIGLSTVADMVNRGKVKKEIKELAKKASELPYEHQYDDGVFQLSYAYSYYGDYLDKFIDACERIKNSKE